LKNDELKIYRGEDFIVSTHIAIHQPTLAEICEYGEQDYYSMIYQLTATPQSLKVQLWDMGIDYTTITPFELFYGLLYKIYDQKKTSIILGNLDLSKFELEQNENDGSVFLSQIVETINHENACGKRKSFFIKKRKNLNNSKTYEKIIIDEFTYNTIMDYIRKTHSISKDEKLPANETTKMILIEDDREELKKNKNKKYQSQLKNMISAMVNCEGFKYNHSQVWDMKINAFMDSVKRISKIKNANLLLQSGYSGFGVNLKEISNKQLNWLGEID